MIIYLDIYFLKNAIFNFLLIYLTSLIIRKKTKTYKMIISATIGSFYAILVLYSPKLFDSFFLKILTSVTMLLISFGTKQITIMVSSFFVLAYFIAGLIASLLNVSNQMILLIFAISTIIIFYLYKNNQMSKDFYDMKIQLANNEIELIAKLDTGNELKDSIFGDSVIVVSEDKIKNIIDKELIKILKNERLEIPDTYINKIKLISYKTISGEGISTGIKLDKLIIYVDGKEIESKAIMILSERTFKNYDVLIGRSLLEGGFEYENNSVNKIKNKGII